MSALRVVHKAAGESARIIEVDDSLHELQGLVGGFLERHRCLVLGVDVYFNEDGRCLNLAPNVRLSSGDVIVGPLFLVDCNSDGELVSLSAERAKNLRRAISQRAVRSRLEGDTPRPK